MRIRPSLALPLVVAAALAVPLTAHATPFQARATNSAAGSAATAQQPAAELTTLITGDRVALKRTPSGAQGTQVLPAVSSGPGRVLSTRRLGNETYVIPAVAEHYLGRFLAPSLFDVTAQQKAGASDRVAVALNYTGSKAPAVPGVTVTSAASGKAAGYLTASSARTFGQALTTQWRADHKAGFPTRSTLFSGSTVTAIAPAAAVPAPARPNFQMYTLILKATDLTGKPLDSAFVALINADSGAKYDWFADIEHGEARISVPAGHYSGVTDSYDYDDATGVGTVHMVTVNQYAVTGQDQTLTFAFKGSYVKAGDYSTPRPSTVVAGTATWSRIAADGSGLSWSENADPTDLLYVLPQAKPSIGSVDFTENWQAGGPGSTFDEVKGNTFDLAADWDHIPSSPKATFTTADLATVNARYYTDGRKLLSAFGRLPLFSGGGSGWLLPFTTPVARTEYVGAIGGTASWVETDIVDDNAYDDPGFIDAPLRSIPAGSVSPLRWNQGPLAAAVPVQDSEYGGYCYTCSTAGQLELDQAAWVDSTPGHTGEMFGDESGKPVTHFQLYRNGSLIDDQPDYFGDVVDVPLGSATYQAVLYVDRRLQTPRQSTKSTTTLGFKAAPGQGPGLPSDWYCLAEYAANCHVLPVLQARANLPTSLSGTLPAGRTPFTVLAHRVQNAAGSTVTSVTFSIRVAGTTSWTNVPLAGEGAGAYAGTLDNARYAGTSLDIKVTAADTGGSTYAQTVLKAYTVAAS